MPSDLNSPSLASQTTTTTTQSQYPTAVSNSSRNEINTSMANVTVSLIHLYVSSEAPL